MMMPLADTPMMHKAAAAPALAFDFSVTSRLGAGLTLLTARKTAQ